MDPITIATLISQVPSLFKLFSKDPPPAIVERAADIARSITGKPNTEEAVQALQADPALMLQYKEAAEKRAMEMAKWYFDDIASARARDTEIQRVKGSNKRADAMIGLAAIAIVVCLFVVTWATDMDDFAKATISLICGRALGWIDQAFSFEFGTTRANKAKDDTINTLSKS